MATFRNSSFEIMVEACLKKTSSALRDNDIPFCLIGSLSAWVRGGPESSHDLDFGIRSEDIIKVASVLEDIGMEIEIPPEDWLFKAWDKSDPDNPVMIDLIYAPSGVEITDEVINRADVMDVLALKIPILNATDLMTMKLLSLREQHLNFTSTIATARSIREQIDWEELHDRVKKSPYGLAFFTMATELGIIPSDLKNSSQHQVLAEMQKDSYSNKFEHERKQLISHLSNKLRGKQ